MFSDIGEFLLISIAFSIFLNVFYGTNCLSIKAWKVFHFIFVYFYTDFYKRLCNFGLEVRIRVFLENF